MDIVDMDDSVGETNQHAFIGSPTTSSSSALGSPNKNHHQQRQSSSLRGHINVPTPLIHSTLDEPVIDTLKRDIMMVLHKFLYVLLPLKNRNLLRDWDWWGPMFLCITLAMVLQSTTGTPQKILVFTGVFVIVWVGAAVVTLNSTLLGGTLSFFQSVCVLGYCMLPIVLSALLSHIINTAVTSWFVPHLILIVACLGWSIFAAYKFLMSSQPPARMFLASYPIFLFYTVLSWLVLIQPKHAL